MPDKMLPAARAPLQLPHRALAGAVVVLCLGLALASLWIGPLALAGGLLLVSGVAAGALLTRMQLRADLAALLTLRGGAGPHPTSDPRPFALLAPVAEVLDALVQHRQALFDAQAEQLETLRRQAHADALTGLPNRRHFETLLDALLCSGDGPVEAGLLLLRVRDLQGLNRRIGHAGADRVLQALASTLQAYPDRIDRCSAGRLNGSDFALLLPVGGLAFETAGSLLQALRLPLARIDAQASVDVGVVELSLPMNALQALSLADAALARAQRDAGRAAPAAELDLPLPDDALPQGEASWQRRIARALGKGQVTLDAFPVRTPDGRQLHLDCPLRVQLQTGGPMEPAARWLQLAQRTRLCAAVDERGVTLALQSIQRDGHARCVNIAAQSLESPAFVDAIAQLLTAAPQAACRLWIDLPEALALAQPARVREVSRRWRPLGVMLGLEHAGDGLARIPGLIELGLDCVRIDRRFVNGLCGEGAEAARLHLQGLVRLVQAVGLQVTAEGVRDGDDLELLWTMGFDAATGPALLAEPAEARAVAA